MHGIKGVHVLGSASMAGQATAVDFLHRSILEREDLRDVAPAGNVGRPGTMTPLAALLGGAAVRVIQCLPVRRLLVTVVHIFMAGFASVCPDVIGGIRSSVCLLIWIRRCA